MEKPACATVFVPLRIGPSHKSEQGSQLLFGEKYSIIDKSHNWIKVRNEFDGYEGWIDNDHHHYFMTDDDTRSVVLSHRAVFQDEKGNSLYLEPGSELYNYNEDGSSFTAGGRKYVSGSKIKLCPPEESLTETSMRFLNAPYLWGGRTSSGMDCSGFTQIVYKIHGHSLPRDSFRQAEIGNTISFLGEARAGDLLFFDNDKGEISHVGILLNEDSIIHGSGVVRIDRIDHQGIFNPDSNKYTHRLRVIKRVI